jgi:hypothetical protein
VILFVRVHARVRVRILLFKLQIAAFHIIFQVLALVQNIIASEVFIREVLKHLFNRLPSNFVTSFRNVPTNI